MTDRVKWREWWAQNPTAASLVRVVADPKRSDDARLSAVRRLRDRHLKLPVHFGRWRERRYIFERAMLDRRAQIGCSLDDAYLYWYLSSVLAAFDLAKTKRTAEHFRADLSRIAAQDLLGGGIHDNRH